MTASRELLHPRVRLRIFTLLLLLILTFGARAEERLVFGSFMSESNASNWAKRVSSILGTDIHVETLGLPEGIRYRVVSNVLLESDADQLRRIAEANQLTFWQFTGLDASGEPAPGALVSGEQTAGTQVVVNAPSPQTPVRNVPPVRPVESQRSPGSEPASQADSNVVQLLDFDLAAQARTFAETGLAGQSRFHASFSARMDYYRAWDNEAQSITFTPFYRYDVQDDKRTHFDLREAFYSRVGDDWDFHIGYRQIFWGVTEFNHLADIVNQTDRVENINMEHKLGQPMVQLSTVRDWGIVDLYVLTGFRERTFPGVDGRPRYFIPIDGDNPTYESSAGNDRIDGAIRWSHYLGPVDFGIYYFSGTSRDPRYEPVAVGTDTTSGYVLRPHYPVIDQAGLDLQAIFGDWAWKLETIHRRGFNVSAYTAANAGFERTLVGVAGSRTDLGLVVEYMYDQRDDLAFDNLFEHDIGLGTRWRVNDLADTQALLGVIWDHKTDETIVKLEASRRLGETWILLVEGRVFAGAEPPDFEDPLNSLLDPDNKLGSFVDDDYIQLELTRYF